MKQNKLKFNLIKLITTTIRIIKAIRKKRMNQNKRNRKESHMIITTRSMKKLRKIRRKKLSTINLKRNLKRRSNQSQPKRKRKKKKRNNQQAIKRKILRKIRKSNLQTGEVQISFEHRK